MQEEKATSSSPGRLEWTREEEKTFETALADIMPWTSEQDSSSPEDNRFEKVAQKVGTKTIEEVKRHYDTLVDDIRAIEAGRIPIPCYVGENNQGKEKEKGVDRCVGRSGPSKIDPERRKGTPWTEEEHKYVPYLDFFLDLVESLMDELIERIGLKIGGNWKKGNKVVVMFLV